MLTFNAELDAAPVLTAELDAAPVLTAELDAAPVITAEIVAVAMQGVRSFEGVEGVGANPAM